MQEEVRTQEDEVNSLFTAMNVSCISDHFNGRQDKIQVVIQVVCIKLHSNDLFC